MTVKPSEFYTGLVSDMYDALVPYRAPVAFYAKMIRRGENGSLELGCGTGHPLLDLVEAGLSVISVLGEDGRPASEDVRLSSSSRCGRRRLPDGDHRVRPLRADAPPRPHVVGPGSPRG